MATKVLRARPFGAEKAATAGGREQQTQAPCCRSKLGQSHVAGRAGKKALKPSRKRELATDLIDAFGASLRKACAVIQLGRVVYLYQSTARDSSALVLRMKEITRTRVHYGYRRVHVTLRREGFSDNQKRVYRLYREQGWSLRLKRHKRNTAAQLCQPTSTKSGTWTLQPTSCSMDASCAC